MHSIYSTKTLLFYNANQPRDSMASAECLICCKTLYLEPWIILYTAVKEHSALHIISLPVQKDPCIG